MNSAGRVACFAEAYNSAIFVTSTTEVLGWLAIGQVMKISQVR